MEDFRQFNGSGFSGTFHSNRGRLKKAASGVLAIVPCSRTRCTLRAQNNGDALRDAVNNLGLAGRTFLNRPEPLDIQLVPGHIGPWKLSFFSTSKRQTAFPIITFQVDALWIWVGRWGGFTLRQFSETNAKMKNLFPQKLFIVSLIEFHHIAAGVKF